jgi:hypothetical protein
MEIGRRRGIQDHSKRILENCWKLAENSNEDGVSGEGLSWHQAKYSFKQQHGGAHHLLRGQQGVQSVGGE